MSTIKQKKAIKNLVENHGNVSRAMLDAGYDPTTAKNPKNLTESKGFDELKKEYHSELIALDLSPKRLAKKLNQFIDAKKPFSSHTEPDKMIDDWQTQVKGVEMLREDLNLKSKETTTAIQINFNEQAKKDVEEFE